jgi:hypothetical protein
VNKIFIQPSIGCFESILLCRINKLVCHKNIDCIVERLGINIVIHWLAVASSYGLI